MMSPVLQLDSCAQTVSASLLAERAPNHFSAMGLIRVPKTSYVNAC